MTRVLPGKTDCLRRGTLGRELNVMSLLVCVDGYAVSCLFFLRPGCLATKKVYLRSDTDPRARRACPHVLCPSLNKWEKKPVSQPKTPSLCPP